ncbi:MAG: hypothetical protein J0I42_18040 [Bosea sp.]|uniref:hypothetical protein n=1 Tax=Bosea sp. (in: a-proteobacteria) TaxID=1871050 RepID=UPI001AD6031A|nr:hypothetical protein [Bosea sp. (in: a-proteobacteria)]MBN9453843.1 hypothetical protein [Bosea sp. (in: a-proteobacteria)]
MTSVVRFPRANERRVKRVPDAVEVVLDFGLWCAATSQGGRLVRRHPATPNTPEAAAALAREMAERDGLRFISNEAG